MDFNMSPIPDMLKSIPSFLVENYFKSNFKKYFSKKFPNSKQSICNVVLKNMFLSWT